MPKPLFIIEPSRTEAVKMHGLEEYGSMYVKLYEDITNFEHIATAYDYPAMVNQRYLMKPSPIPRFDNPKMNNNPALQ